jgi:hypothetical protein
MLRFCVLQLIDRISQRFFGFRFRLPRVLVECKPGPGQGTEVHARFPLTWRTPNS